jgi:hypothetical protein
MGFISLFHGSGRQGGADGLGEGYDRILKTMRKYRTVPLKIGFPLLFLEGIIDGKQPYEVSALQTSPTGALLGILLILLGLSLRAWARGHFNKGALFTTGPYAIVRHPLYLGSFLATMGAVLILHNWLNWVVIPPLFILFYGAAILHEERVLSIRFGSQWHRYKARVPALVPRPRRLALARSGRSWSWRLYLSSGEVRTTLALLLLPAMINALGRLMF